MKKIFSASALALMIAFGGAAARAEAPATPDAGFGEKVIALLEKMADLIDANKADCPKMGDALNKFMADNGPTLKEMQEKGKGMTKEQKEAWATKYKARLEAASNKMMTGIQACQKDAKVLDALKKMPKGN
jgi:hypothetical protein